jgi:quercetin dioxygenase-like cupin family protein
MVWQAQQLVNRLSKRSRLAATLDTDRPIGLGGEATDGRLGAGMNEEILFQRGTTLVRRMVLAPGEAMPWHHDPHHRVTVIVRGDAIGIEHRDGRPGERYAVRPGQVDWDEPTADVHRGVNVGTETYEEVVVFLLDRPESEPQPRH